MINLRCILLFIVTLEQVTSQCTFSTPFASSTWLDSTRGTLVFTDTQVSGWGVSVLNQDISSWDCYNNASSSQLVLKSSNTVAFTSTIIHVYACLVLTKVTDVSYTYVLQQITQANAGYERLSFSTQASASMSDICNNQATIPTLEFHVLVKQGMGASAAVDFPDLLLKSVDYEYKESDGTVACNGTQEALDMCSDTTQLYVNYSYCPQEIAYTAGGQAWCVAKKSTSGYDCAVVMNQDATISGTAAQFACICSNGNKMSVVANNCTANQNPTTYPTAADGVTVIGYLLDITNVLVSCAPDTTDSGSSSSNVGVIVGIVIVVLLIIAIVVVSIVLYKRGNCVTICIRVKGCFKKTPCWGPIKNKMCSCCKNKVAESEEPILTNGNAPHVETIDETAARPKLLKDKSTMSAITRSSTIGGIREKSDLDKSLITRQATATSIGLDMKSERSVSVQKVNVKSAENDTTEDAKKNEESKKKSILSILPCFGRKDVAKEDEEQPEKEEIPKSSPDEKKPTSSKDKIKATGKKGGGKKAKGDNKGKKGKQANKKPDKTPENDTEDEAMEADGMLTDVTTEDSPRSKQEKKVEYTTRTPRGEKENKTDVKNETPRGEKKKKTDVKKETPRGEKEKKAEEKKETPRGEKGKKPELIRAPTKMNTELHLTSTPVPGNEKGKKGVVSVPAALVKPGNKRTEWTFLSCCFGKRSPPPQEDSLSETNEVPIITPTVKKKVGIKTEKKAVNGNKKGGGGKKTGGKKGGKHSGKKPDVNGNDVVVEDLTDEPPSVERAKTMPEKQREKTSLSMKDAEKVKVDVYIPDDKTNLTLKDTVIVKENNGEPQLLKAKSDIGLTRPASSKSTSSRKAKKSGMKKDKKNGDKSKGGSKSGSKDKKKKKK